MSSVQFSRQPSRSDRESNKPLTHHEIMGLVGPFSERGYAVDLKASDRARRRLCFRPQDVAAVEGRHPALQSRLTLELPNRGPPCLVRELTTASGLTATMVAEGRDVGALLAHVEGVSMTRQLRLVEGTLLALSYHVASPGSRSLGGTGGRIQVCEPRLTHADARVGPVTLRVSKGVAQEPFRVELSGAEGRRLKVTEDFLAVLGWRWRALRVSSEGVWRGTVKPPAREPLRTEVLESMLVDAVAHLVDTLGASPAQFHGRYRRARWRAAFQRVVPLLTVTAVLGAVVAMALLLPKTQETLVIMFQVPPLLMVLFFAQSEIPTIEIPPVPRQLTQPYWYPPAVGDAQTSSAQAVADAGR